MLDLNPIKRRLGVASGGKYSKWAHMDLIHNAPVDLAALVSEVERLRSIIELHKERITNKVGNEPWANYKLWESLNDEP